MSVIDDTGLGGKPGPGSANLAAGAGANVAECLAGQRLILAQRPGRLDLLRWTAAWPLRHVHIRIHRNQPFEFVASVLGPFLAFAGLETDLQFGPYDDTLGGVGEPPVPKTDVEIIWLDFARYLGGQDAGAIAAWLAGRVRALRVGSRAPILIADAAVPDVQATQLNIMIRAALKEIPGAYVVDQAAVLRELGDAYVDERSVRFAGSSLSDAAAIETARRFGLAWIPGVVAPRLKAIVVDLDDTLYDGVLGEAGPAGLILSHDRAALQNRLIELADSGLLLAVLSRNELEDVVRLFDERPDFPIRLERFSAVEASWRPKAEGMAAVLRNLRIGADSVLFLDDNPGELAAVAQGVSGVRPLHAADAGLAVRGLRWYPGLAPLRTTREDSLRASDLASAEVRGAIQVMSSDPQAYLRSLGIRLGFARSPLDQVGRIHELLDKTNQFNTAFSRLSEAAVAALLADPEHVVVTVSLQDRLSDSGVVGLISVRLVRDELPLVEELAISCRALGRGVEDAIIAEALRAAVGEPPPDRIRFAFHSGARNGPAREWLSRLSGGVVEPPEVEVPWFRLEDARREVEPLLELVWREG
jgi:FkbH-like protein